MKVRKMICKRILIYFCCTVLLSSSVFASYSMTVCASDIGYNDLLRDATAIALAAAGIYFSGGALTPSLLLPFISSLAGAGFDVADYVTQDEEAGTTTISADFVNLVLQAYKQYQEENGVKFDGTMSPGSDGYYYFPDCTFSFYDRAWDIGSGNYHVLREWTDIYTCFPCAILNRPGYHNGIGYEMMSYIVFYNSDADEFYNYGYIYENGEPADGIINTSTQQFIDGYLFPTAKKSHLRVSKDNGEVKEYNNNFESASVGSYSVGADWASRYSLSVLSSSIPIYNSLPALKAGLRNGDFSFAQNYGKTGECETPAYTGTYDGGDITVPTEKLEGIQDKLDEIDKTDKDIYEKLKELLEWLIGHGGSGGGIDMTVTNSWLEKIYLKVSQIFDKISETAGSASDAVHAKIQEQLDEVIAQLKKIKRWTAVDTVIDGVDAIADWLDLIRGILKDAKEGAGSAVAALTGAVGDSVDLMAKKFPFSIPWDILFFVSVLSAEPQVPHFEIPFNIELSALDITVDYTMELDFSHLQWLSDLSRLLLSMTYAVGLMKMTSNVVSTGKEG